MFELVRNNDCFWLVKLPRRAEDGSLQPVEVLIKFRLFTRTELQAQRKQMTAGAERLATARAEGPDAINDFLLAQDRLQEEAEAELRARIVGWKGIVAPGTSDDVPYSDETRDWLLEDEARFKVLRQGLLEASRGAVAKN